MAWSTRQLAELAGTTLKAVRHYHQIGLLDEPERAANGYKQYGTAHLVRLLQIMRLKDLGVPLSQIATMIRADEEPDKAIRDLDAELATTIERLQRVRSELAIILHHRAPIDIPAGFESIANVLSEADRGLIMVYSRLFSAETMDGLLELVRIPHETDAEFNALPADADDATIRDLVERLAPFFLQIRSTRPWMSDPANAALRDKEFTQRTMAQAVTDLYNPAQVRVLVQANAIADRHSNELLNNQVSSSEQEKDIP